MTKVRFTETHNQDDTYTLYLNGKKVVRGTYAEVANYKVWYLRQLRSNGEYFAAGALARQIGHDRNYGCHTGMRSTLNCDRDDFYRGYDSVK